MSRTSFQGKSYFIVAIWVAIIIVLLSFLFKELLNNGPWVYGILKKKGQIVANDNAWEKTKHGDLAAYSTFIASHLFLKPNNDIKLTIPDSSKTDISFAKKLWYVIPSIYLFPASVTIDDSYGFQINESIAEMLVSEPTISENYRNFKFHLLSNKNFSDVKHWAVYIHSSGSRADVFTLPFGYLDNLQ